MYQMRKSRTFSSLLLQECDHRAQEEVQIFESRVGLCTFLSARLSFVGGAFEIEFVMHCETFRDEVLHDDDPDILGVARVAVEAKELW